MKKKQSEMLTTFVRGEGIFEDYLPRSGIPDDFQNMAVMMAVLAVLTGMSVYSYGIRALILAAVCLLTCWAVDSVCLILRRRSLHIHDLSPMITGLTIAVMMPASVPYHIAVAACVFAICIAKHPLGCHGSEIINCAAAGYIFAELSFPQWVLMYPKPFADLPADNIPTVTLYKSLSSTALTSGLQNYSGIELLIGNFTGPMGCTFTVLTAVCALFLMSRRAISAPAFFGEIGAAAAGSLLLGGMSSMRMVLVGGMTLFAAILTSDRAFVPKKITAQLLYGLFAGILLLAVMRISALENPAVYVCVIAAPFGRVMDSLTLKGSRRKRVKRIFGSDINETIDMIGGDENGEDK